MHCEWIMVHQHRLRHESHAEAFVAACTELEQAVTGQEYALLVSLWQYGRSARDQLRVGYVLGISSAAAYSPWIKSAEWKRFLRTIEPLVEPNHDRNSFEMLADASGVVVPSQPR